MKSILLFIKFAFVLFLGLQNVKANNLSLGTPINASGNLQFTISWENSWRTSLGPSNWDAVWIFVKRQSCTDNLWQHALLSTNALNHSVTGGVLEVEATSDGMGVFVRRSADGYGNIGVSTVTLDLQVDADNVDNFKVFGIEMVAVPQGEFYIGDLASTSYGFFNVYQNTPKLITAAIQSAGIGVASNYGGGSWGSTGALPSTFPLGYNSFYSMKYEISQELYCSFLNSLTFTQQVGHTAVSPASVTGSYALYTGSIQQSRNSIKIQTPGIANDQPAVFANDLNNNGVYNEASDGQFIACNFLSWADFIAVLDWAALRPMTEFEFEKSCRGSAIAVVAGEYAWGTTSILKAESGLLSNPGQNNEISTSSGSGLCAYGAGATNKGPLRCGFAATSTTGRAESGGSYYGIMELSGNVSEQCVGGYSFDYSAFTTANGDGELNTSGAADVLGWPVLGGGYGGGGIARGGNWYVSLTYYMKVSERATMTDNSNRTRNSQYGGRGVRNY